MSANRSLMHVEAAESSVRVAQQRETLKFLIERIGCDLRAHPPRFVLTCARGSSDHAATFGKYLFETELGLVTASAAPSVSSIYDAAPSLADALVVLISQSGRSPDLVRYAEAAARSGGRTVALVNMPESPLSAIADHRLPLGAGLERSVAATKSYICSLAGLMHLVIGWKERPALSAALDDLPGHLATAATLDWSPLVDCLREAKRCFVVGRGFGLGIAQEAALKLKETCGLHAEAISAAEIEHGPMAAVDRSSPVLIFSQGDESAAGLAELAAKLRNRGLMALMAAPEPAADLPVIRTAHAAVTAASIIQSFYMAAADLSLARGLDPDAPPHLQKITETL